MMLRRRHTRRKPRVVENGPGCEGYLSGSRKHKSDPCPTHVLEEMLEKAQLAEIFNYEYMAHKHKKKLGRFALGLGSKGIGVFHSVIHEERRRLKRRPWEGLGAPKVWTPVTLLNWKKKGARSGDPSRGNRERPVLGRIRNSSS